MCKLSQGEANVAELEATVGINKPTLSQQLGVMRRLKLVETRRAGKMVFYRIEDKRIYYEVVKYLIWSLLPAGRHR